MARQQQLQGLHPRFTRILPRWQLANGADVFMAVIMTRLTFPGAHGVRTLRTWTSSQHYPGLPSRSQSQNCQITQQGLMKEMVLLHLRTWMIHLHHLTLTARSKIPPLVLYYGSIPGVTLAGHGQAPAPQRRDSQMKAITSLLPFGRAARTESGPK